MYILINTVTRITTVLQDFPPKHRYTLMVKIIIQMLSGEEALVLGWRLHPPHEGDQCGSAAH